MSTLHDGSPSSVSRRQVGIPAKCELPIPVKTMRSQERPASSLSPGRFGSIRQPLQRVWLVEDVGFKWRDVGHDWSLGLESSLEIFSAPVTARGVTPSRKAATRAPIIAMGRLMLPRVIEGMIDASAT